MSEHDSSDGGVHNYIQTEGIRLNSSPSQQPSTNTTNNVILYLKQKILTFFTHPYGKKKYSEVFVDPIQLYPSASFRTIDVTELDHSSGLGGIKGTTQTIKGINLNNEPSNKHPISTYNLLFPSLQDDKGIPRLFVEQDPSSFYLSYIHLLTHLANKFGAKLPFTRRLRFSHLIGFYLLCMLLNYTFLHHLGVRFEWLILCALMIRSGSRAWELSPVVFMFWILVYITSNILLWLAITLDKYFFNTNLHDFYYLCDFILYIYSISKILDYTLISWVLSLALVILSHYCSRVLPEYNFSTSVCAHAMAFAFYLCTSETLVQVIFQKNKSYSNPVLGFDRTDLVHNYRYLVMSGKLHPISLPNHYQNESSHFGKWYQTKPVRGAGLELQSSSDQILWPNGEAILDSFELCVAGIESNSIHLSWSLPMSLLYPLSRSKTLMKEASEQDRLLLNISLPLNPNELMTHPIHPSCVDKNDIIVRLDDIVYRDWNYDPHTNSLLVFGLQPLCNYVFTVSILGFRSMKCYTTTLPETLDTLSIDNTDNQTHSDINQVINIQRQVDEARRLKKEEQSNLKKLKRDKTQLESRTQTLLGQTLKSIQRLQLEEGQLIQKIQKFKDEILSGENWIETSDDLRKELKAQKESLLAQVEVKKSELAIEQEKLSEIKKQLSELQTKYQKEHDLFISSIKDTKESLQKLQAEIKILEASKQTLIETTIPLIQTQIQHKKDLFGQLTWCKDYIKRLKKKSTVGSKESDISEEILPLKEDLDNWISTYKSKVDGLRNTTQELKTTVASEEAFCERLEEELEKIQKKKKSDTK